jgi:O-antigen ligase
MPHGCTWQCAIKPYFSPNHVRDKQLSGKCVSRWLIAALAALFVLPLVWPRHTLPIPSFYGECLAAILLLIACLACVLLFFDRDASARSISLPVIAVLFLPLIAILIGQVIIGRLPAVDNVFLPIVVMLAASAAIVLGSASVRVFGVEKLLLWIAMACVVGGVFNVVAQLIQFFGTGNYSLSWVSRATSSYYGNLAQRNHLATYLAWSLIGVFYLYAKRYLHGYVAGVLITVLLVGITLTASRMTWLQCGWIAASGAYLMWRMRPDQRPQRWLWIMLLPLAYLVVTVVLPHLLQVWNFSTGQTGLDRVQAQVWDGNRWLIYSQAWEIFKTNPLVGVGPGELWFNQFLLMDHYEHVLFATSAHNLVLDLLVTTGVLGLLSVTWLLVGWFLRIRRSAMSLEKICIVLMLAVFGIHTLLEFPQWYGFFLFPAAFLLGCLETRFWIVQKRATLLVACAGAGVVIGIALCITMWTQYVKLENLYASTYYYNPKAKPADDAGLKELESYSQSTFFKAPAAFLLSWNLRLDDRNLAHKLQLSEQAMHYQAEANVVYRHIVLLGFAGQQEQALFYLVRLKNAYPAEYPNIEHALLDLARTRPELFADMMKEARQRGLTTAR